MTLICTLLAAASHFRGPSHSPRFLLALLILTFPTLLITLLAFLVDILLFIPHMAWGGWIVLAATIIITACSVLTCAMRRTLVSRKARKRRIAENSDMNGDNFYAMKQPPSGVARAESPPPMEHAQPKPAFATYDQTTARTSTDDRTPLNQKASSIQTSSDSGPSRSHPSDVNHPANTNVSSSAAAPAIVAAAAAASVSNGTPSGYRYDPDPSSTDMTHPSERMRSDRGTPGEATRRDQMPQYRGGRGSSRGAPPYYGPGRGGMAPPQRGGPGMMRGGYGPQQPYPGRGGYGPGPIPRGGLQNAPPPGWNSRGRGMPGGRGPPGYGPGPYSRGQPSSPQEYDTRGTPFPPAGTNPLPYPTSPNMPSSGPYSDTRSPYGAEQRPQQDDAAAVIDAYGASPELPPSTSFARSPSGGVERDPASFGFSGRRSPARGSRPPRDDSPLPPLPGQHSEGVTPDPAELDSAPLSMAAPVVSELDSRPQTIPEMHGNPSTWNGQPVEIGESSPRQSQHAFGHGTQASTPIELPSNENIPPPLPPTSPLTQTTSHTRSASENYYEDVPARFATDDPILPPKLQPLNTKPAGLNPTALQAISQSRYTGSAYEEAANPDRTEGSRSPAASETSNFTSISQRPVNPSWRPPPGPGPSMMGPGFMPGQGRGYGPQSPQQGGYPGSSIYSGGPAGPGKSASRYRDQEVVLNANPDFALPGAAGTPNRRKLPGAGARQSSGSMGSMMDRPRPRGMSGTGSAMGAGMSAMAGQMGSPSQGGGRFLGEF
jgi:hypothetical protein